MPCMAVCKYHHWQKWSFNLRYSSSYAHRAMFESIVVFDVMKHSPPKAYMPLCRKMVQEEGEKFYIFELGVMSGSVY